MSETGPLNADLGIFPDQALAFSFTVHQSYADVSISPDLAGSFPVTAYLMTRIGPGTTLANQIAINTFSKDNGSGTFQAVLQNISIGPGTYFVVLGTTTAIPPQGMWGTTSPVIVSDVGASVGLEYVADMANAPLVPYSPADLFNVFALQSPQFVISGNPAPEPLGLTVLGMLVILSALFRRNRTTRNAAQ